MKSFFTTILLAMVMVVSGAEYQQRTVNTVSELTLLTPLASKPYIEVLGYYAAGDGGGGTWYWDPVSTITTNEWNYGAVRAHSGITTGRYRLITEGSVVKAKQWGAVGDGDADDTAELNALLTYQTNSWGTATEVSAFIEPGSYKVTSPVLYGSNTRLAGVPRLSRIVRGFNLIDGQGKSANIMRNLSWQGLTNAFHEGIPEYDTNIHIFGITWENLYNPGSDTNALFKGGGFAGYFVADLTLDSCASFNAESDWNITLKGNRLIVDNCTTRGSRGLYEDGLHFLGGRDISVTGGYYESGDDSIALTTGWGNHLEYVTVRNVVVNSNRGFGLKIANEPVTGEGLGARIGYITVDGMVGYAGQLRSGGVQIREDPINSTPKGELHDITVENVYLDLGNPSGKETSDLWGLSIRGGTNVLVRRFHATPNFLDSLYIEYSNGVRVEDSTFEAPYDTNSVVADIVGSSNVHLINNSFRATNGNAVVFRGGGINWVMKENVFQSPNGTAAVRFYNEGSGTESARLIDNRFMGDGNGIQLSTTNMASLVVIDNIFDSTIGTEVTLHPTGVPATLMVANNINYTYPTPVSQLWAQNASSSDVLLKIVRTGASATNDVVFSGGFWYNNLSALNGWVWRSTTTDATTKTAFLGVGHYTNSEEPFGIRFQADSANNAILYGGSGSTVNGATIQAWHLALNNTTTSAPEAMRLSTTATDRALTFGSAATSAFSAIISAQGISVGTNVAGGNLYLRSGTGFGGGTPTAIEMSVPQVNVVSTNAQALFVAGRFSHAGSVRGVSLQLYDEDAGTLRRVAVTNLNLDGVARPYLILE